MTKICSKCKTAYSATSDFFYRDKSKKDGFGYLCKKCKNEYVKQYDLDNPDKMKQRKKLWKQKNPEKIKQQHNKYWQENPDKKRFYKQQRRAKKRSLQATFITEQWDYCKYYFNNKCAYCGKEGKLAQDHFIPLNNNGDYTINNIIPACRHCNSVKHSQDFFNWYKKYEHYSKVREQKILKYLAIYEDVQQLKIL